MKLLTLAVVVVAVVGATRGLSEKRRRSPSTSVSSISTTKATEVVADSVAYEPPNRPSGTDKDRGRMKHRNHEHEDSSFNQNSSKDKRSSSKGLKSRKGKRQKSVTPSDLSLVTPALFDPSYSTLASTTTSIMTDPPPFTFTNITIKRKVSNNTEMSVNIFFIWPSSSLPSSWFTTQSPEGNPSLTVAPFVSRNFSVDIHLSKEECIGEFHCSLIPETVFLKVMVPLDEWVRVTIEQSFFIYNTRYFIQLYNNNISRRSESKVFSTPLCRKPARNYRACLDSKNDVNPSRQDNGNTELVPQVVCLAMDQIALDNHQIRFRVSWNLEREHIQNLTNLAALGRGVVDQFLKAQASGKTRSDIVTYNSRRKQLVGSYSIENTFLDIDLVADEEFVVEVVMRCDNWTVVYESLKVSTKIETLRKKLSEGVLKFCPSSSLSGGKNQLKNFVIVSIIVLVFLLSFMSACLVLSWKKCREIKMSKTVLTKENSYKSSSVNLLRESVSTCGSVTDEWEIEAGDLELGKEVGQGAFGKVVYGLYKKQRVAVKVLKDDIHSLYKEDLLREIALLKSLGTHQGIVSILGASTLKEPLALVLEYMPYGNLYNFLRRCRSNFDWRHESRELVSIQYMHDDSSGEKEVWEVTSKDLISWARQVAVAMEYMATKQYVHRDLAARNILLGTNKTIKLCDFGLARLIYRGDGHYFRKTNTKLPIKWMALESIRDRVYTSRSDVWSFGILLWEIATFGSCPYPTITLEDLPRYLEEGYRMPQPSNCSDELYLMMMDCWRSNPEDRPTFNEIRRQLEDMLSRDVDYLDLEVGEGESPFSVNRMPNSGNDDNNNRNEGATDDSGDLGSTNNNTTDVGQGTADRPVGILPKAIGPPSVEKKAVNNSENKRDPNQGKDRPNEETKGNLSLPHLVKSKEFAIDKALVKSAAGKSFGGKIADNVFYHRSVINDPRKAKKKKREEISVGNNRKEAENVETIQRSPDLRQGGQQSRLAPHPQITINSDINSESFPLLQMSPPPTSPIHSNFRLLDSVTDPGEQGSTGSSDRSPSGDTEDTRSSWMLDII